MPISQRADFCPTLAYCKFKVYNYPFIYTCILNFGYKPEQVYKKTDEQFIANRNII